MRVEARVVGRPDPRSIPPKTTLRGRVKVLPDSVSRLVLEDVWISGVDFSGRAFDGLFFGGRSIVENCDFSGMRVSQMGWGRDGTILRGCTFRACNFPPEMVLGPVRFERCDFDSRLEGMFSHAGEFVGCTFAGSLVDCTFFGRPSGIWTKRLQRRTNEVDNNDFSRALFSGTGFRAGVLLHAQRFPPDVFVTSDSEAALERFETVLKTLGESAPRVLTGHARAWRNNLEGGQLEEFFNPADLPPMPEEVRQRLIAAVRGAG